MNKLAIYGAGGHGKVVADVALLNNWKEIFFFDENFNSIDYQYPYQVIGDLKKLLACISNYDGVFVAIGNIEVRMKILSQLKQSNLISLIHPSSEISEKSKIGDSSLVMPGVIVNANTTIGRGCILNSGSIIEHDCYIGDGVHLAPGSICCANVNIEDNSWIGAGTTIIQGVKVGKNSFIGAGSVVIKNVESGQKIVGNPASKI